jgi:hypothetical protein
MTVKDKILRIIIYFTGLISLFLFIILRFNYDPEYLLDKDFVKAVKNSEYGDLYFLNYIDNFKIPIPPVKKSHAEPVLESDVNNADILTFGDSFFASSPRFNNVPGRLADSLKKRVFFFQNGNPLTVLEDQKYRKKDKTVLILESCERLIPTAFISKQKTFVKKNIFINTLIQYIYPNNLEQRYEYLMQRSFINHYFYTKLATFKFNFLGYITPITPKYTKDPPWLFCYQEVDDNKTSYYYKFSDEEIKSICDNIQDFSVRLKEIYDIDFIFLPVPNKYTIYHKIINNDEYNNLLPVLYRELKKRNVKVCELYELFMHSDKELYYPTDTHWNDEGVDIAMSELLKIIRTKIY